MQSETGYPSSHQLKSYVAYKSCLKLEARAVLSADAVLLVDLILRSSSPFLQTSFFKAFRKFVVGLLAT